MARFINSLRRRRSIGVLVVLLLALVVGLLLSPAIRRAVAVLGTLDLLEPWWLLLLAVLPILVVLSWSNLGFRWRLRDASLTRRRIALALRVLAVGCVVLALAEPRLRVPYDHTTVLFVLDRSASIPEEL